MEKVFTRTFYHSDKQNAGESYFEGLNEMAAMALE